MKFTKMSLVAALLVGSSAFAIENTKVSGDAKLYYQTTSSELAKDSSSADTALNLNLTTDLVKNDLVSVSAGAGYTVLSTLGLEQNLVSSTWGGAHSITGNTSSRGAVVNTADWMNEAWLAVSLNKASKTTLKLGRMKLDTPLAFTETWSIEQNSFEAIVAINQDIPDTTIVAAYVGNGNGTEALAGQPAQGPVATAAVVNQDGKFDTYGKSGAYTVGVINNSFKPVVAQAWYYNVTGVATAYWLQADLNCQKVKGLTAGVQYTSVESVGDNKTADTAYALKVGYEVENLLTASLAYSSVNDDGSIGYAGFNTATSAGAAQSKLYTEAWWSYGNVTKSGSDSINLTVEGNVMDYADLGLYVTAISNDGSTMHPSAEDLTEVAFTVSKSFGPLDVTAAIINVNPETGDSTNYGRAYLTLNF